ncbi:hypothetical protein HAX54_048779, partial [Datura stramonium]|nr:hypothetical protein [Datura stramonium]
MASDGWPPLTREKPPPSNPTTPSYIKSFIPEKDKTVNAIPIKEINYAHGKPIILWEEEEVNSMIEQENLQFALIGKFSYGWQKLDEIRKIIPLQCEVKVECKIGFLRDRHILIRLSTMKDYVHIMSKLAYFLRAKSGYYHMRPLKWKPWFNTEETATILACISFSSLSLESLFTMEKAVGKSLHVDMATKNQTRPSCAK